mgnify:CR=1 FL=1
MRIKLLKIHILRLNWEGSGWNLGSSKFSDKNTIDFSEVRVSLSKMKAFLKTLLEIQSLLSSEITHTSGKIGFRVITQGDEWRTCVLHS